MSKYSAIPTREAILGASVIVGTIKPVRPDVRMGSEICDWEVTKFNGGMNLDRYLRHRSSGLVLLL